MGQVRVADLDGRNVDDVFRVCSFNKLNDPLQKRGCSLKRNWLLAMLDKHGPLTKIAYLDGRPVAQILFYPEDLVAFTADPRRGVVVLHCAYNPFPEARGKGVGTALVRSLVEDCRSGLQCLGGRPCGFIVAKPFNTGEGVPLKAFYAFNGFEESPNEMFLEISESYQPRRVEEYRPLPEDRGRAVVFYNPLCEYSYPFAVRVREFLKEIEPKLNIELIDEWLRPWESIKRRNQWLVVNSTPIKSFWTQKEDFRREVEGALRKVWS